MSSPEEHLDPTTSPKADFESQLKALEAVVDRLERGDLTLEESVKLFEQGLQLSDACKNELEAAEGKIQVLIDKGRNNLEPRDLDLTRL